MEKITEKLQELANNQEFTEKMENAGSTQEALSTMKEYGIDATEDELVQAISGFDSADGELSEDMLDNVAGGGKIWDWIKKKLNNWFKRQSKKNADDIGEILDGLYK